MTDNDLNSIKSILAAALAMPPEARPGFLDDACGPGPAVRSEVEALLEFDAEAGGFMETPLAELLGAGSPAGRLLIGQTLSGRYMLESLLAESGFATVFYARDENVGGKAVVVKVLDRIHDRSAMKFAFRAELQSLSSLNHPGLVGITDVGETGDAVPFLVLTYVPGVTLREVIARGPLPALRVQSLVRQAAQALGVAHKMGIAHLDVKPENIVVTDLGGPDERVTIIDFGIARLHGGEPGAPTAGSRPYMAPEQEASPGPHCDVYSLGLVAFELLTGRLPQSDLTPGCQVPVIPARAAVAKALDTKPDRRFNSAAELAQALAPPKPRRRWMTTLGFAAAVALLILAIPRFFQGDDNLSKSYAPVRRFANSLESEQRPAFSPDGEWLYYVVGLHGRLGLFRKFTEGGEPVLVLPPGPGYDHPHVSPDGRKLGFISGTAVSGQFMTLDLVQGGAPVPLSPAHDVQEWSWSPDGTRIVGSITSENRWGGALSVFDLASRTWQSILIPEKTAFGYYSPQVSPDGKLLAFVKRLGESGESELYVVPVDSRLVPTGAPRRIPTPPLRLDYVCWAPDSSSMFFLGGPLGQGRLWRGSVDGGEAHTVPGMPEPIRYLAIPRFSRKLALGTDLSDSNIWSLDLRTGSAAMLFGSTHDDELATLSPDGKRLAFTSERSGGPQVWVSDPDGSNPRQITHFPGANVVGAIWARDGQTLIISIKSVSEGKRIYTTSAIPGSPFSLLLENATAASLSADGKRLYFAREVGDSPQLWVADYPGAGHSQPATSEAAQFGLESPTADALYFAKRQEREGLWKQPIPAGKATRIVDSLSRRSLFVPARNGIYYVATHPAQDRQSLFFLPYHGGKPTNRFNFPREVGWGLHLTEDERTLLFAQYDTSNDDIYMVDSFR